jgi:hypothetical protein
VGFWGEGRAHPSAAVDAAWAASHDGRLVLGYVARHGMLESHELAYSWCRFGCAGGRPTRALGCATLTDGVWVWPEGLAHYLQAHAVRPPQPEFVAHVLRAAEAEGVGAGAAWAVRVGRVWPGGEAVPEGTAEFLRRASTLPMPVGIE